MEKSGVLWLGEPIEELTKSQLVSIIAGLLKEKQVIQEEHNRRLDLLNPAHVKFAKGCLIDDIRSD